MKEIKDGSLQALALRAPWLPSNVTGRQILEKTMRTIAPLPSQRGYAEALASIFAMHIHRNELMDDGVAADDLPSASALVVAPTGQGKTFLFRKMAGCMDVNVIVIDCTTLSAEGWKGISLSQQLSLNYREVDDSERFERSIILFDEIDKLKHWGTKNDQGNPMVNILQMFNNGTIALTKADGTVNVPVGRFTVLFGGAFEGLDDIVRARVCPKPKIGFSPEAQAAPMHSAELLQKATIEDLAKFGLMRELLGRIGTILSIPKLGLEDFQQLLNARTGSIRCRYENYLSNMYGVTFEMDTPAADWIAQQCMKAQTGARAATPLVDAYMREAVSRVEDDPGINQVILTANDDGCSLRYAYGNRKYSYRDPARLQQVDALPWHIVKAASVKALTSKLVRYYLKGDGDESFSRALEYFLGSALWVLMVKTRPGERTFESLEKLARTTHKSGQEKSSFDNLMDKMNCSLLREYRSFRSMCGPDTQPKLVAAMRTIMAFLETKHGTCQVRFELLGKPVPMPTCESEEQ